MSVARGFPNAGHYYSNLVKPIEIDCQFTVDATNGLGITGLKSNGYIRNVFMHTSGVPTSNNGYLNPNPANGYALIQFNNAFNKYINGYGQAMPPVTGAAISISGAGVLTLGAAYEITSVGVTPAARFTVTAIADAAGNSAGKYFTASDVFSNNYVFYNLVSSVGLPPALVGPLAGYIAIPVAYPLNSPNGTVASAIGAAMAGVNGGNSFSTSVIGATATVTNAGPVNLLFPINPTPGTSGYTIGPVIYTTLAADWQTVGLPLGLTPALGQSFIATATGGALGTGQVRAVGISGIGQIEIVGDPTQSINSTDLATYGGAWVLVKFLAPTNATTTTPIPTAPTAGTTMAMTFKFDGSNVTVDGL